MEYFKLDDMLNGWFIGNFEPSLYNTNEVEVAIKKYKAGDFENAHYHKIATEFTAVIRGEVEMNGRRFRENEIIKIAPNVITSFKAITDVITLVVKLPGANNDKYEAD
jgi:hypothetical protein